MNRKGERVKVSVIIPAYNSEQFIRICIESVVANTLDNMEIIVVDDGSTDRTADICREYAEKFDNVSVIHQKNGGQNNARLAGVCAAQGDYIGFVDSDDWVEPTMYSFLWQEAVQSAADIVCCGCIYEKGNYKEIRYNLLSEGVYEEKQILEEVLPYVLAFGSDYGQARLIEPHLCDKLFRRNLILHELQTVDRRIMWGEDALVTFKCIAEAKRIAVVRQAPYHYRIHADSVSRKSNEKALSSYPILLKNLLEYCEEKRLSINQVKWYAITAARDMLKIGLNIKSCKFWQFPYKDFKKGTSIVLYGAGDLGRCYYMQVSKKKYFSDVIWTDSNIEKTKKDGRIYRVDEALEKHYDFIIIAVESKTTAEEIKKILVEKDVAIDQIYWKEPEWMENTFTFCI